ncbi:MAG TPA: UDP-N-acetylmuramoyl-tripeptide--D-alanyl-D-alanine ligase, partial [Flavisolibacter sp.]|nr:UDP-N-acetylmuramoyl-tripeptide--D-alanyl-D-alanine ligase [Flavisolibacter sp.]
MPSYSLANISRIVSGKLLGEGEVIISHLVYDSRRIQHPETSLFFALHTAHGNGHRFVENAYAKGVRAFVVTEPVALEGVTQIVVTDTLASLQQLAAYHRRQFSIPVIGITGSNGKTIVKEWLNHLLEADYQIIRSPKSYNSQLGVALSVWQMESQHTLAIFEAGISQPGEMSKLQEMIQPTTGVFTNIGEAHSEGFASMEEKLREKLQLFTEAKLVVGPAELLASLKNRTFTWSTKVEATLEVFDVTHEAGFTTIHALYRNEKHTLQIPFSDEASVQNAITCWCVLLQLGMDREQVQERFRLLHAIDMRLQLARGINNCLVVNDSYSADTTSLKIALDFLAQQSAGLKRTVILSDFFESGKGEEELYTEIAQLVNHYRIQKLVAVGKTVSRQLPGKIAAGVSLQSFSSTEEFLQSFKTSDYHNEIILVKGARKAGFERIASLFEQKLHGTVLQINLSALTHN